MKLLILAHTPPPFHGQSYMVQILLGALGGSGSAGEPNAHRAAGPAKAVQCVHVDFRLSDSVEDIGRRPWAKLFHLVRFCLQAILLRLMRGADILFYIPAPALRNALYRDWLVMLFCRPFFRRRVYWWQAGGLGAWLATEAKPWERRLTGCLVGRPDLSIVMGPETESDARELGSRRTAVVPNAIPDPCRDDAADLVRARAERRARLSREHANPGNPPSPCRLRLLFISLCHREKGLFDALEALALVNRRLADTRTTVRVELDVAGRFYLPAEQLEFEDRIRQPDLLVPAVEAIPEVADTVSAALVPAVRYHGFAGGTAKDRLFREADALVFPTYYAAETFGLVVLEAMAYGLDVITTRWRNVPELLPRDHPNLVEPKDPTALAEAVQRLFQHYDGARLRRHYEDCHSVEQFREHMESALLQLLH